MKSNNVYIICTILFFIFTQSCSKMNDLHQKYLDEGEIIYGAKVDSVGMNSGKERAEFALYMTAQRIETTVFLNDYKICDLMLLIKQIQ